MNSRAHTSTLPVMSTNVTVISVGTSQSDHSRAMSDVTAEVERWQQLFSRFRPESLLSQVNLLAGKWTPVVDPFLELLESARDAVIATEGRFNPAILPMLEAHGYDRTIADVQAGFNLDVAGPGIVSGIDTWMLVEINRAGMQVRLPEGLRLDFGGIAKGALADRLGDRFGHWRGGAISIGGDMSVWGEPPEGDTWHIGIEHPLDSSKDIARLELPGVGRSAVATSSLTKRAWRTSHGFAHHLIDPFTGMPIKSDLLAVTVNAPTALTAEVVAKNLMVASAHEPLIPELLLDANSALTVSERLALTHYTREAA